MKNIYGIYLFSGAPQYTLTRGGSIVYELKGKKRLLKLHTPFPENLKHSWYFVLDEERIIDCYGYIEERCLQEIETT